MESILREILESAMKCAVTGIDPEKEVKRCAKEIVGQMRLKMDTDVTISYHHQRGTDGAEVHVEGRGACIIIGLFYLVGSAALQITDNKEEAMKVVQEVYEGAKNYVETMGGEIDGR